MKNKQVLINTALVFSAVATVISSCNIINPAEPTPAYISIDTIMLSTSPSLQGSAAHKITDAWVYVDNELVGTYEMPARFPVLASGTHTVSIKPGVLLNGINATHLAYPFYQFINKDIELTPGQETKVTGLTTTYTTDAIFVLKEDFEGLIPFSPKTGSIAMTGGSDPVQSLEGGYGVLKLDTGMYGFEVHSNQVTVPQNGRLVYLEMNYKNSAPFLVILESEDDFGTTAQNAVISINTQETWNKIYIELRPTMLLTPNAQKYRIVLGTSRQDAATKEEFYFDNVKVVRN